MAGHTGSGSEPASVRGIAFVRWWTARYTRGLRSDVRERRVSEISSDVHEQALFVVGSGPRSVGRAVVWRTVRGIPADLAWRKLERNAMRNDRSELNHAWFHRAWSVITQTWFAPIAVLVGLFDLLASIAIVREDSAKMPGQVIGPIVMTSFAISMFSGLWLRWSSRRVTTGTVDDSAVEIAVPSVKRLVRLTALLTVVLVILAIGIGTRRPVLFFLALALLALTALVLGVPMVLRAVRSPEKTDRSQLADAMVIAGTLPALAFFWMVVPALLAIAVISGVLGTGQRFRSA